MQTILPVIIPPPLLYTFIPLISRASITRTWDPHQFSAQFSYCPDPRSQRYKPHITCKFINTHSQYTNRILKFTCAVHNNLYAIHNTPLTRDTSLVTFQRPNFSHRADICTALGAHNTPTHQFIVTSVHVLNVRQRSLPTRRHYLHEDHQNAFVKAPSASPSTSVGAAASTHTLFSI